VEIWIADLERRVERLGSNEEQVINVRFIAASKADLKEMGERGQFRSDLYYRLNIATLVLPPLRERREDIAPLVDHYLALYAKRYDRPVPALSDAARAALVAHDWPGNVRALRHAVERAVILSAGGPLEPDDFPLGPSRPRIAPEAVVAPSAVADLNLDRAERRLVEEALRKHGYNISLAASELGLSRAALYRRMEKHGL